MFIPESLYQVRTDAAFDDSRVHVLVNNRAFYFEVRACSLAHVVLMERPDSAATAIHVVIGDNNNRQTSISFPDGQTAEVDTPNILSCELYRKFWVSWENEQIRIGRGLPYDEVILARASTKPVTVVALSTDDAVTGDWRFMHDEGNVTNLH